MLLHKLDIHLLHNTVGERSLLGRNDKALGTFIPGRLGTSLVVCRDNNKYGGSVTSIVK